MKITPREKAACRLFSRGVIFTRARLSLALLALRKNGGLLVVYNVVKNYRRMFNGGTNLPPSYKLTKYSQLCAAVFLLAYDASRLSNWYISIVDKTVEL